MWKQRTLTPFVALILLVPGSNPTLGSMASTTGHWVAARGQAAAASTTPASAQGGITHGSPAAATPAESTQARLAAGYGDLPISFEPNVGQAPGQARFVAHVGAGTLALESSGMVLTLPSPFAKAPLAARKESLNGWKPVSSKAAAPVVVDLQYVGASPRSRIVGVDQLPGVVNYYAGSNAKQWRTRIPTYAQVAYRNLYPGIDLVYHGQQGRLEYDFLVQPGARVSAINLQVSGADPRLDADGALVLGNGTVLLRQAQPVAYQVLDGKKRSVESRYVLAPQRRVRVSLGAYDHHQPLVIDPVLVYGTYIGAGYNDTATGVAVDGAGNAYVSGYLQQFGCGLAVVGGQQTALDSTITATPGDMFVGKLNPTGSALLYTTYFGPTQIDSNNCSESGRAAGIAVDSAGNAYVAGWAQSDLPVTSGVLQPSYGGFGDAFVSKLDGTGQLLYSTYLGGTNADAANAVAVDPAGDAYVTGNTQSADFPGAGGAVGGFVTEVNPTASAVVYSTALGGGYAATGNGIAVDAAGNAYVTGEVGGGFPTTPGAYQTSVNGAGNSAAFVAKLAAGTGAIVYGTYLSGTLQGNEFGYLQDLGKAIAIDGQGDAYVTGQTDQPDFPVTGGVVQGVFPGTIRVNQCGTGECYNSSAAFVSELSPNGSALVYSTFLGGSTDCYAWGVMCGDAGQGIALDSAGDAFVTGLALSADFPTTADALQASVGAGSAAPFLTELPPGARTRVYSTVLGSEEQCTSYSYCSLATGGTGVALDGGGGVYVGGGSDSADLPTSLGAVQSTWDGFVDAFVVKLDMARYADLPDQDTEIEHDTQRYPSVSDPTSPINAQIFNAPVAYPYPHGWQARDTTLVPVAGTNAVTTAYTPFTPTVSLAANDAALVSLASEEAVPLSVGVSSLDGGPPAAVAGSVLTDTVTYAGASADSDLAVRATVSGVDLSILAQNTGAQGAATLSFTADPTVSYAQDAATGAITVTDTITQTDMNGEDYADPETVYFLEQPVATDGNTDPSQYSAPGQVAMSLGTGSDGQQIVTLQVDASWLHDPSRVFPVHIDLPLVTADSARLSGAGATLDSCRPAAPIPLTDVIVGVAGSCTYNGLEYFDVRSIPSDAAIQSATLHLYTPDSGGMTGIMVYQNGPTAGNTSLLSWLPPTWNPAPPIVSGSGGVAQGGTNGSWQTWDVTSIVQQWQSDNSTNFGVTLTNAASPIRVASALGAGSGTPDTAPYLSVVYSPAGSGAAPQMQRALAPQQSAPVPGALADGASTIYGLSGALHPDLTLQQDHTAMPDYRAPGCQQPVPVPGCGLAPYVSMISGANSELGAQYMRVGVLLACPAPNEDIWSMTTAELDAWWDSPAARKGKPTDPDDGTIWDVLASAHYDGRTLIPIVDLKANPACALVESPSVWYKQALAFAQALYQNLGGYNGYFAWYGPSDWIDFEIGNEENTLQKVPPDQCTPADGCHQWTDNSCASTGNTCYTADLFSGQFPADFAEAVKGLADGLAGSYAHYRIMPGGVLNPTASGECAFKLDTAPFKQNIILVQQAIYAAENVDAADQNLQNIRQHLAVALHPYQYGTPAFVNFAQYAPALVHQDFTNSTCHRVDLMLSFWKTGYTVPASWPQDLSGYGGLKYDTLLGLPIFFTEVNWTGHYGNNLPSQDWSPNYKGSYLADLFTWLNDHDAQYHTGSPSQSPLRVLWFDGADFNDADTAGHGLLGIYDAGVLNPPARNGELPATIPVRALSAPTGGAPQQPASPKKYKACVAEVKGTHNLSHDFLEMRSAACW